MNKKERVFVIIGFVILFVLVCFEEIRNNRQDKDLNDYVTYMNELNHRIWRLEHPLKEGDFTIIGWANRTTINYTESKLKGDGK